MDEGVYTVRKVQPAKNEDDKEMVFLDIGMSGFKADAGKFEEGDEVKVEKYEDFRGDIAYRVAGKVDDEAESL